MSVYSDRYLFNNRHREDIVVFADTLQRREEQKQQKQQNNAKGLMSNNTLSDADLVTILLSKRIFDESNTSEDSDRVYKSLANLSRIRPHNSLWHLLDGDTQTDEQTWRPRVDAFVRCLESLSSMNMDLDGAVPLKIEAAGLTIDLKISILSELWLTLLPLVFWIRSLAAKANSQLDHRRHYVVGVSGPPGETDRLPTLRKSPSKLSDELS